MEIVLTQGRVAQIDEDDWPLVSQYKWYAVACNGKFYAQTKEPGTNRAIYLHQAIMGPGYMIDHHSGDGLDCRRANLRRCRTQADNNRNVGKRAGLSSRFKGVHWHKGMGKWQAKIKVNHRSIHLGYFADEKAAARAYDSESVRLHGEFGRTNFPQAA